MTKGSMNVSKIHDGCSSCIGRRSAERAPMLRLAAKKRRVLKREDLTARADAIEAGHVQDYYDYLWMLGDEDEIHPMVNSSVQSPLPVPKKRKAKKMFLIECRYTMGSPAMFFHATKKDGNAWRKFKRYAKEKDRDNAMDRLLKKNHYTFMEFRIPEDAR